MTRIVRGRGWRPNVRPFSHRFSAVHRLSVAAVALDSSDLSELAAPVEDQGPCGSCTGHATSDGAYTSFGKAGAPLLFVPSPRGLYGVGRAVTRSHAGLDPRSNPLTDEGAYPSDVMEGISRVGLRAMGPTVDGRFSDCGEENVNDEPELDELEEDQLHLVDSHGIDPGTNFLGDLTSALSQYAVPAGFFVDMPFEDWNVLRDGFIGAPKNPNDPQGGGHYVDIVGFARAGLVAQSPEAYLPRRMYATAVQMKAIASAAAKLPASDPLFWVKNSWSATWGLGGFFIARKEWALDYQASDFNAIVPRLAAGKAVP